MVPLFGGPPIMMVTDRNDKDQQFYAVQELEMITGEEMTWFLVQCMVTQMEWELHFYMCEELA